MNFLSKARKISPILAFSIIVSLAVVFAAQTNILTIETLGKAGFSINLQKNEKVSGEVFISHSIKFWIADPDGFVIKNFGIINQTTPYEFTATKAGTYSLMFQSISFGETSVQATYNIERLPSLTITSPTVTNSEFIIFIVGVAILIIILWGLLIFGDKWLRKNFLKLF